MFQITEYNSKCRLLETDGINCCLRGFLYARAIPVSPLISSGVIAGRPAAGQSIMVITGIKD